MICENCGKDRKNAGPFRDDAAGRTWASLCGGCKIRVTLADPQRKARMEADFRCIATAAVLGSKGDNG